MARSKQEKREIRARAREAGVRYTTMARAMGLSNEPPGELVSALDRAIRASLERLDTGLDNPAGAASRVASALARLRVNWKPVSSDAEDDRWDFGYAMTRTVCDGLEPPRLTPEQILAIRAPQRGEPASPVGCGLDRSVAPSEGAFVGSDRICEVALSLLCDVGPLLMDEPAVGYAYVFSSTVDDYLCPPCDADFEYFNEDSDD